jgi:hypothetical protein
MGKVSQLYLKMNWLSIKQLVEKNYTIAASFLLVQPEKTKEQTPLPKNTKQ